MSCRAGSALRQKWRVARFLIELSHFPQRGASGTGSCMRKWGHRRSVLLATWFWCHAASWMRGAAAGPESQRRPFLTASFSTNSEAIILVSSIGTHIFCCSLPYLLIKRKLYQLIFNSCYAPFMLTSGVHKKIKKTSSHWGFVSENFSETCITVDSWWFVTTWLIN